MKKHSLAAYFVTLVILCAGFIGGAKMLGRQGNYLAAGYMLTPALAAIITRLFFYGPRFSDANLRYGKTSDYIKFWLISLGITFMSYAFFTLLGAIKWDFSGDVFIRRIEEQSPASGQSMRDSLPPGMTVQMMLILFAVGGLTVFNIFPGIISGLGEELGHRGFMFPALYRIHRWVGILGGGLIWYAWHWPLLLVTPPQPENPPWLTLVNWFALGIGSVCTFVYLAYVYVKTQSVFVVAIAHIVMNNSAQSLSYFVVVQNQIFANLGVVLAMIVVVAILYFRRELGVFREYFEAQHMP